MVFLGEPESSGKLIDPKSWRYCPAYWKSLSFQVPLSLSILELQMIKSTFHTSKTALALWMEHMSMPLSSLEHSHHIEIEKGDLTQNVLGVCTFDLQFSFVYAGWEGSAHDTRVLDDAFVRGEFSVPPGKYYLGDAGYPNKAPFNAIPRGPLSPSRASARFRVNGQAIIKNSSIFATQVFPT